MNHFNNNLRILHSTAIFVLFVTYMSVICEIFELETSDFTMCTYDYAYTHAKIWTISTYSSFGEPYLFSFAMFMSITPEISVVEALNFTHMEIYVLCIYKQIILIITQVFIICSHICSFYNVASVSPEIFVLKIQILYACSSAYYNVHSNILDHILNIHLAATLVLFLSYLW